MSKIGEDWRLRSRVTRVTNQKFYSARIRFSLNFQNSKQRYLVFSNRVHETLNLLRVMNLWFIIMSILNLVNYPIK
ncbi:hypothetical protein H8356DRAFT_1351012 [Neocallimastix lanati (nom. inval.)]|nr:hypothetical protein H8356DRAFT_1351012 [Neocallimastix sp. JGI-2020a]